ncbi:hypothetical protein HO710_00210 [Streptococcus suis]|nr:hypothetical protein [Streptococcus suis]NQG18411.1 hypothetical protein [Streptococcus suis]
MIKKTTLSLLFYLLSAFGISLTIKANIGVSSFNSLNVALSNWLNLEVGTITGYMNLFFLITTYMFDSNRNKMDYFLMILSVILLGFTINYFVYYLLSSFTIDSYICNIGLFILGTILAGIGTGRIQYFGLIKFPIETFCQLLESKSKIPFPFFRYGIDIVCISSSILISSLTNLPLFVREGTIISLILLSYTIGKAKSYK